MTWGQIGARLEQMSSAPGARKELAASTGVQGGKDLFTTRGANLANVFRGTTVPSRDVLIDLLQLVQEERGPLSREVVQELWRLYRAALREKSPATYARYVFQDGYVAAILVAQSLQQKVNDLQERLQEEELAQRAQQRVQQQLRLTHAVMRRSLAVAEEESQQREGLLQQSVAQLSVTVAGLERELAETQTKLEGLQEQVEWQASLREQAERDAVADSEAWAEREAVLLERLTQAYETLEAAVVQARDVEAVLRARESQWQQQARSAQAEAGAARSDAQTAQQEAASARAEATSVREAAAAVREQAARAMREQREEFEAFTARAEDRYERAVQRAESLEEQLVETKSRLAQSKQEAVRADAMLSRFLDEQRLTEALNDILDQGMNEYGKIGSLEVPGFDVEPASNQTPSSEQPVLATAPVAALADEPAVAAPLPRPGQPALPSQQRQEGPDEPPRYEPVPPTQPPAPSRRLTGKQKRQAKAWGLLDYRQRRRLRRYRQLSAYRRRTAPGPVRTGVVLIGLAACALGVLQVIDGRKAEFPDLYEPACTAVSAQKAQIDCVSQETGRVEDKLPSDGSSTRLTVARNNGTSKTLTVDDALYYATHRGSEAKLTVWNNRIIKIEAAGKSSRVTSGSAWPLLWATILLSLGSFASGLALKKERIIWGAACIAAIFLMFCTGIAAGAVIALPGWWAVFFALPVWIFIAYLTIFEI
ncbi:hypothetical protein ABZ923_40440 [Streptomyces sp. NPDC046881]|uniref:hypothetical protein n=1 Tax=Streptomyces sp. NPDC046881 TaxID=3155374 RepID=UPI0033CBED1F